MEKFSTEYNSALVLMEQQLERVRYSESTRNTYLAMMKSFLSYVYPMRLNEIQEHDIKRYHHYLVKERNLSASYQNQSINAIKFYLEKVCGQSRKVFELERPIKEKRLPMVLTEKEVSKIIHSFTNMKHKALILTIYSTGLRISEALHLKLHDIDSENMRIWVRGGKGKKDRVTILSKHLLIILREYYKSYKPKEYLFEGPTGKPYSASSTRKVLQKACKKAGITKDVKVHTLRHCFGTHLVENGTNLRYIQDLMGHGSSKTTEIYTHVSNDKLEEVRSPLENLFNKGYI